MCPPGAPGLPAGRGLLLRREQVETGVMTYDGTALEVECAGKDGRAYSLRSIRAAKFIALRDEPLFTAA